MTILGKYRRRKAREQQLKYFSRTRTRFVRSTTLTPKHRLASNINHNHRRNTNQRWSSPSPRMKKQLVVQEHLSAAADENTHPTNKAHINNDRMKKRTDTILLQAETGRILQREVEYFLQSNTDKHCTVLELAEALKINDPCLESLTKKKNRPATPFSTMCQKLQLLVPSFCSTKKDDEDTMKLRYRWNNGLDGLVKRPTSRDTVLSSWAEAKHYLEDIFVFQTPSCPQDYRMSNATATAIDISSTSPATEEGVKLNDKVEEMEEEEGPALEYGPLTLDEYLAFVRNRQTSTWEEVAALISRLQLNLVQRETVIANQQEGYYTLAAAVVHHLKIMDDAQQADKDAQQAHKDALQISKDAQQALRLVLSQEHFHRRELAQEQENNNQGNNNNE